MLLDEVFTIIFRQMVMDEVSPPLASREGKLLEMLDELVGTLEISKCFVFDFYVGGK